ncbi:zinc finger protein [Sergentomyia squamirostris]
MANSEQRTCRTCLKESQKLESLYENIEISGKRINPASLLKELVDLDCEENDGFPAFICFLCIKKISNALTFKEMCKNSEIVLREERNNIPANNSTEHTDSEIKDQINETRPQRRKITKKNIVPKKTYLSDQNFHCDICGKTLSNKGSYRYHRRLHSDETPYLCNQCGEKFKTRNAYDGHMMTHTQQSSHLQHLWKILQTGCLPPMSHPQSHRGEAISLYNLRQRHDPEEWLQEAHAHTFRRSTTSV